MFLDKWKLTYEILYANKKEPTKYELEFIFFESAMRYISLTEECQNLLSFTIERITH